LKLDMSRAVPYPRGRGISLPSRKSLLLVALAAVLVISALAVLLVAATLIVELTQEPRSYKTVQCTDTVVTINEGSTIPSGGTYASQVLTTTYTTTTNSSASPGRVVSLNTSINTVIGFYDVAVIETFRICTYLGGSTSASGS